MSTMIVEIFNSLKICLLVALFTGFVFGYLYTKLKAYEFHQPDIKKFRQKIASYKQGLKKIEAKQKKLNGEIENYESKLKETNESILKYKEQFLSQKDLHVKMLAQGKELKSKYEDKKSILEHYHGEIDTIKQECRLDDVSNIEENKESIDRLLEDKKVNLRERQEKFSMMQNRVKSLDFDSAKLEERFHELNKKSENMALQIVEKNDEFNALEKSFLEEYDELTKKITLSQERVTEFKERLVKLKNY